MWEAGSTKSLCVWRSIYNTLRFITKHMKPVSGEMKAESVKVPCLRLEPRLHSGLKMLHIAQDCSVLPWLSRPASYIKEPCLPWDGMWGWAGMVVLMFSNYPLPPEVHRGPAQKGVLPGSSLHVCPHIGHRTPGKGTSNHVRPSTAPSCAIARALPGAPLLAITLWDSRGHAICSAQT